MMTAMNAAASRRGPYVRAFDMRVCPLVVRFRWRFAPVEPARIDSTGGLAICIGDRARPYSGAMRVVTMGVTGSGKSRVGTALAAMLGVPFADADDFHPESNVAKMSAGIALTDEDRWPWLDAVGDWLASHPDSVVACSALKRAYRDRLRSHAGAVVFVHLAARQSVLVERVARRTEAEGHFAGVDLLGSQYATLEPLRFDEVGGTVDVSHLTAQEALGEVARIITLHDV